MDWTRRHVRRAATGISRRSSLAALALILCAARAASGQGLNLDPPPDPPPLDQSTYAKSLVGELENEVADLVVREATAGDDQQLVLRTSIDLRTVAADLLAAGDAAGSRGSVAVVLGVTLASGRDELDRLLQQLLPARPDAGADGDPPPPLPPARRAEALQHLAQFRRDVARLEATVRTADVHELDRRLPVILAALARAVSTARGTEARSHWPTVTDVLPGGAAADGAVGRSPPTEALARRLAACPLAPRTRAELEVMLGFLERGERFARFRPQVQAQQRRIAGALALGEALERASWMDLQVREAFDRRLHEAVVLFRDPETRPAGERRLDRLESSTDLLDRMTALAADDRVDMEPVQAAFLVVDGLDHDAAETDDGARPASALVPALKRMIEYREQRVPPLPPDLRPVYREAGAAYGRAEALLVRRLPEVVADPAAMSDPALASLVADHAQRLEDLQRIARVPAWIDTLSLIDPRAGRRFSTQVRRMCTSLLDEARRPGALEAMDRFERELDRFYPLPLEGALRAADPVAIQATGGQQEALVARIDEARAAWARAWADGQTGGEATGRMRLLHQLGQTMHDTGGVFRLGGQATALNPWAAWELVSGTLTGAISQLPSRLKLATASAVDGDDEALARQLDQIDRDVPLARLLGRLARAIGPRLEDLPGGAVATIGQVVHPPSREAWMVAHRAALADLCRYAMEEDYARGRDRGVLAEELSVYANRIAEQLLDELGE